MKKKKIVAQRTKESDKSHTRPGCKGDNFEKKQKKKKKQEEKPKRN